MEEEVAVVAVVVEVLVTVEVNAAAVELLVAEGA